MGASVWTAGRLKSFITSTLRGGFRRYPPKYEVLKEAFVGKKINPKSNRLSSHYKCNMCKEDFPTSDVNVDHVNPIVDPSLGFTTWDSFIENLFCDKNNLQVLCSTCHTEKTSVENKIRKATNDSSKKNNKTRRR
jgi:5-methylcytosine-specific restriction endonuclease McrA